MTREILPLTLSVAKSRAGTPEVMDWLPEHLQSLAGIQIFSYPSKYVGWLTVRTLYNYHFDSDEVATAVIYAIDGSDFALAEKYGDRASYDVKVIDKGAYGRFVVMMAEMLLEEQDVPMADENTVLGEGNPYLTFTDGPNGQAVHIRWPSWHVSFPHLFETHNAFHFDETPVKFVAWAHPMVKSFGDKGRLVVVEYPDGSHRTIDGIEIAFVPKERTTG